MSEISSRGAVAATVGFGFCLASLSSFGQTWFIALSGPGIRGDFGLSHGGFGAIYSGATLASAIAMMWLGGLLDRISVRHYAMLGLAGLFLSTLTLAAAPSLALLGLGLFGLRLFGQGMVSHTAQTVAARLPHGIRGRGVGVMTLGYPSSEAIYPYVALTVVAALGWTRLWWGVAALLAFALVVIVATPALEPRAGAIPRAAPGAAALSRRDIVLDRRFLLMIPGLIGPPAIATAYFFHQRAFGEALGWSPGLLALCMTAAACGSVISSITIGILIDRHGAVRMARFHLLPLLLGCLASVLVPAPASAVILFATMGATGGANSVVTSAALAEIFGVHRLATARAMATSIGVAASASTPWLIGIAIDSGVGPTPIGLGFAAYMAAASISNARLSRHQT